MSTARKTRRSLVAVLVIAIAGCTQGDGKTSVTGTVVVDGKPALLGSISFMPVDGRGPSAGAAIVDGHYTSRVIAGDTRVAIRVPKVIGQKKRYDTPDSPMIDVVEEALPARYNDATDLRVEVKPGVSEHNFDLSSS